MRNGHAGLGLEGPLGLLDSFGAWPARQAVIPPGSLGVRLVPFGIPVVGVFDRQATPRTSWWERHRWAVRCWECWSERESVGYKRKLIEVALPLDAISAASAREKLIRHGHPSTLHLWWARRPLAAARAVLYASLVDDPSAHPDRFPTEEDQAAERRRLFRILERLVVWKNSNDPVVLARARAEIEASCNGELPNVLDPFCGGGTIPLEAQRLGLPAYGGDLNPVAVLISKALVCQRRVNTEHFWPVEKCAVVA